MAVLTPLKLPAIAAAKNALVARLGADLQDALDATLAQAPDELLVPGQAPMLAPDPRNLGQAVVTSYDQVQNWPTVLVTGWALSLRDAAEQALVGRWEASIEVAAFLRDGNPDRLARALDRWASALYLIALSADAENDLGGARLLGFALEPREPGGRTSTDRAVLVTVAVEVWN